jgi:exodeoxyribonuclease-5
MNLTETIYKTIYAEFPFIPSSEQAVLLDRLAEFSTSLDEAPTFILKGYAGTGKTTLVSSLVKGLTKLSRKTVLLAPTGRAAKVFAQRSGRMALTIHKKIYRKETVTGGGVQLLVAPNLHTNTIFLIDEASMIADYSQQNDGSISSRNLLEDIIGYVFSGKNCKLIFIGDRAQLPPVGSDASPALDKDYLQNYFPRLTLWDMELKNVLRQAENSAILYNATALRSAPENSFPKFTLPKNSDLFRIVGDELQDALESAYSDYGKDETIVITRSNKRANQFNQQIRGRILWMEDHINQGDQLMVVKNNYFWLDDKSDAGFIANGELISVERLGKEEHLYGFHFIEARVKLLDYPKMDSITVKLLLDVINEEAPNLPREKMKQLFFAVEEDYLWEKNKRKRYERIMADPYFNALQVKFAYAITCHKSQGGQWGCVFIDQGYLTEEMLDHNYFRWLYTAFTRPTEKLYLVNFHDEFFKKN